MKHTYGLCMGCLLGGTVLLVLLPGRAPLAAVIAADGPLRQQPALAPAPKRITVVADKNFPPFLFSGSNGQPRGYAADVWKLFEQHTGIQVTLVLANWSDARHMLDAGRADVLDATFKTPERKARWDFSSPYGIPLPVNIYIDKSVRGVRDLASLRGFTVGVQRDDACAETLRDEGHPDVREFAYYADVVRAAAAGQIHVFCLDLATANYYLYLNSALRGFDPAFELYSARLYRAVRKSDARLLPVVERGMAMITPAEHKQLNDRWLRHPSFAPWPYWDVVIIAVIAVVALLLLLVLWLWLMRRAVSTRTEALNAARNRLRALFDASPDAMSVKDRDGIYLDCNDCQLAMFNRTRESVIGKTDAELFDADFVPTILRMDAEVVRTGQPCTYSFLSGVHAGGNRCIEVSKVPLSAPDGRAEAILSVARDITERTRAQEQVRLWALAFEHAAFGVAIFHAPTRTITAVNATFAAERGYSPAEMAGMSVDELYPHDLVEQRRAARKIIDAQEHSMVETEHVTRDGRRFPVQMECTVTHDVHGNALQVIVHAHDLSETRKAQNELRLAAAAFQSQAAMAVLDADLRIRRVNDAFVILLGYRLDEVEGQPGAMLRAGGLGDEFYEELWGRVVRDGYWRGELWAKVKKGQPKVLRATVSAVRDEQGRIIHYVISMIDLTRELEAHANVDRMTFFDRLTDLPNRNFLLERLKHTLQRDDGTISALMLLDLDHFKRINDLRGHVVGDRLLLLVAQRLQGLLDNESVLSRFHGGTYALLVQVPASHVERLGEYMDACAQNLLAHLRQPFRHAEEEPMRISGSIGWIAVVPGQGTPSSVLRDVELAMYEAKSGGRDRALAFRPAMRDQMVRREALVSELRQALVQSTLDVHLQPQTDRAGAVVGAEMLLRWTRQCGERVSPAVFIPVAEEAGLIVPIGEWVLRRACEQLVAWSGDACLGQLSLAVNVSVKEFAQPEFVERVRGVLLATGAPAERLKLEITESVVLDDLEEASTKLRQLRQLGLRVSLDDFGTGYSSLAYLSHLPVDQLKIDQSFVQRLEDDAADAMVAQTIIGMGHALDMEVIAEGVETAAQHDFLLIQGCDAFQGYLFARPMPLSEFEQMVGAAAVLP